MDMSHYKKRKVYVLTILFALIAVLSGNVLTTSANADSDVNTTGLAVTDETVTVGLLHSMTGTIAINEVSVADAEKMAIEEINAGGGVLGRQIKVILEDGASDWPTFAEKAKKLLQKDKVPVVFGCYTSASRKAVLPVFENNNGLLFYPTYYEGLEASKNVIYTAAEATQQTIASIEWLINNQGKKKFYFIGSDYIWPRTTNKIAKATIKKLGGKVIAEEYTPLGHTQYGSIINKIKMKQPDVIFSTIVGGSNVSFYKQLKSAGISGDKKNHHGVGGYRGRSTSHWSAKRYRGVHHHGVLPDIGQPGQQKIRRNLQGEIWERSRNRRCNGMRLCRTVFMENGGGKSKQL